jgi:outer membrane protein assembly factor BamB
VGSSPAVANGVVYVGSDDDNLYAFAQNGTEVQAQAPPHINPKTLKPNLGLEVSKPGVIASGTGD